MTTNVTNRLTRLEARRGTLGEFPHTQDLVALMNKCDLDAAGALLPDEKTYTAVCKSIAPRKSWPTYDEMADILRRADELLAVEAAAGRT